MNPQKSNDKSNSLDEPGIEEGLSEIFSSLGTVESTHIIVDRDASGFAGWGFLDLPPNVIDSSQQARFDRYVSPNFTAELLEHFHKAKKKALLDPPEMM